MFMSLSGAVSRKLQVLSMVAAGAGAMFGLPAASHALTNNLLDNPSAELGTGNDAGSTVTDWVVGGTSNPGRDNGAFDGFTPPDGSFSFYGGSGASGTLSQLIDLSAKGVSASDTDAGKNTVQFSFQEQSLSQGTPSDEAEVKAVFEDASHTVLAGGYDSTPIFHIGGWETITSPVLTLPTGTRFINYEMIFTRQQGTDLDGFIDANSTTVTTSRVTPPPPPPGVPLPAAGWMGLIGLAIMAPLAKIRRSKIAV